MQPITFEQIKKSYSGSQGCMCGCNGKYAIASHYGTDAANKETGWEAYDNCSDRSVKIAISKINKAIIADDLPKGTKLVYEPGNYIALETGTRMNVVYFK